MASTVMYIYLQTVGVFYKISFEAGICSVWRAD